MKNAIAFEVTLGATATRLITTRLVGNVTLTNTDASRVAYVSTDGGATRGTIPSKLQVRLEGVNLSEVYVWGSTAGLVLSVIGNST